MDKRIKVQYQITFGTETIPFLDADVTFLDELQFTNYLDLHRWANAPMAFPQINLLISTLDPIGCKCNNWRDHLRVLLANGFNIQAIGPKDQWMLKKAYFPVQFQFQKADQSIVHFGHFFRLHNQTADEQFPNYCEAADYPPGTMRTISMAHFDSEHILWATTDLKSEVLIRKNHDGSFFSQDRTMTYLGSTSFRKAE